MNSVFTFKQFSVNQHNCAMKVNTDGVLLGAIAAKSIAKTIVDIGTGTGVIALMLAQRFPHAKIDAVEIDLQTAQTATTNFSESPFAARLEIFASSFQDYFLTHPDKKYDLIVSNPPFYIHSLLSPQATKNQAKHADIGFFNNLMQTAELHLNVNGVFCLIVPPDTASYINSLKKNGLFLEKQIEIRSFTESVPHRFILFYGQNEVLAEIENFVIYQSENVYSTQYQLLLKPFLTIF